MLFLSCERGSDEFTDVGDVIPQELEDAKQKYKVLVGFDAECDSVKVRKVEDFERRLKRGYEKREDDDGMCQSWLACRIRINCMGQSCLRILEINHLNFIPTTPRNAA